MKRKGTSVGVKTTEKLKQNLKSLNHLWSSLEMELAWSDTNMSCVLFRDLKTRVWTECFCTSCNKSLHISRMMKTITRDAK